MKRKITFAAGLLLSIAGILLLTGTPAVLANSPALLNETSDFEEDTMDIFRLYNSSTGEHFYTSHEEEREALIQSGWKDEGIGWISYTQGSPVYRLYNPFAPGGDHYYTTSKAEGDTLVYVGWKYDFNAEPVFYSGGNTNVYVEYNPNAASGTHNYTTSLREHQSLLDLGWTHGAVAWKTAGAAPGLGSEEPDSYTINTYSKVFHRPDCLAIPKIPTYRKEVSGKTATQLIAEGYIPCPLCDPAGESFLEQEFE